MCSERERPEPHFTVGRSVSKIERTKNLPAFQDLSGIKTDPFKDYVQIGVAYHGKDEKTGTIHDRMKKSKVNQDTYAYDHQQISFTQDARQDTFFLTFKYDMDLINSNLLNGENFNNAGLHQFRIKWCGENFQCRETQDSD